MSRNRYTHIVHKEQRARIAAQEKELQTIARRLHRQVQEAALSPETEPKQQRRTRLERRRLDKRARYTFTADRSPAAPINSGIAA